MILQQDISLKPYNTFGIDVKARYFIEINSIDELRQALLIENFPNRLILGGGSNMLLTRDIEQLVLYINIRGVRVLWENEEKVALKVMAGENWHDFVIWCLERGFGGLENLSLIPGNVGTAPIQNIGAYGVELKDVFESCEAMSVNDQRLKKFTKEECQFGYRDSFFKNQGKGQYVITSVNLILTKKDHNINTSYGAIEAQLNRSGTKNPTIRDVSDAVIAIRKSKLPDPAEIGNSGSFFKNPVISAERFNSLSAQYPELPSYKNKQGTYKIPAGWLIEKCGYKGKRFGDAGVHENQALVLVNYGGASGSELLDLAKNIQSDVEATFGIELVPEVNILG